MAYKTIKIKKYLDVVEEYVSTAVAISPGHLVELTSAGLVQKHSTSGGNVLPMFALEDELQSNGIDTPYAVSVPIQVWIPTRGDIVYAKLADGQTAVKGSFLESAGTGALNVYTADSIDSSDPGALTVYPNQIVGQALEALDLSSSTGADTTYFIAVRII